MFLGSRRFRLGICRRVESCDAAQLPLDVQGLVNRESSRTGLFVPTFLLLRTMTIYTFSELFEHFLHTFSDLLGLSLTQPVLIQIRASASADARIWRTPPAPPLTFSSLPPLTSPP